jgi:hypothetical protein
MRVTGEQDKRMLQDKGRDPHIVGWDGSALLAQLPVNGGVVMGGLLVGIEDTDTGFQEKSAEHRFVARSLSADGKSGAQFSEDNERQPDLIGVFDGCDYRCIAAT